MKDVWIRTLRRAKVPMAYSQGFHAHPKITFATASPVGEESKCDYMDVVLDRYVDVEDVLGRLRAVLPPGLSVAAAFEMPLRGPSLMSLVEGFTYSLFPPVVPDDLEAVVAALMAGNTIVVERKTRAGKTSRKQRGRHKPAKQTAEFNIRPMIRALEVEQMYNGGVRIHFETVDVEGRLAKPREIIQLLGLDPTATRVVKEETLLREDLSFAMTGDY
jgi:radical SAM-linked protein